MIYLLYGSDTRKSQGKLKEIVAEFRKKGGTDFNFYKFDAEEDTLEKIKETLKTRSLFAANKLVVVKYPSLSPQKEELSRILEKAKDSSETTIILWDRELSAKDAKDLAPYSKKVQEFKSLKREELEPSIFRLGDTFFTAPREGLRSLLELLHYGHDDFNLFSYLSNHARTLLTVHHYLESKKPVPSKHGIHPFVVKKTSVLVRSVSAAGLHRVFHRFFEEDHKIKVGLSRPKDALVHMAIEKK